LSAESFNAKRIDPPLLFRLLKQVTQVMD